MPLQVAKFIKSTETMALFGSQGRALQVATEILVRQKGPIRIKYSTMKDGKMAVVTYKLLPRTINLINELTPLYGGKGQVLTACTKVLRDAV